MSQADQDKDWLEPNREGLLAKQKAEGLRIASLYLVFEQDPRGKELLKFWQDTIVGVKTATNAPTKQYVWDQAQRSLVQGIAKQIELAKAGFDIA